MTTDTRESIARLVERNIPQLKVNAVNAAIGGYNVDTSLIRHLQTLAAEIRAGKDLDATSPELSENDRKMLANYDKFFTPFTPQLSKR